MIELKQVVTSQPNERQSHLIGEFDRFKRIDRHQSRDRAADQSRATIRAGHIGKFIGSVSAVHGQGRRGHKVDDRFQIHEVDRLEHCADARIRQPTFGHIRAGCIKDVGDRSRGSAPHNQHVRVGTAVERDRDAHEVSRSDIDRDSVIATESVDLQPAQSAGSFRDIHSAAVRIDDANRATTDTARIGDGVSVVAGPDRTVHAFNDQRVRVIGFELIIRRDRPREIASDERDDVSSARSHVGIENERGQPREVDQRQVVRGHAVGVSEAIDANRVVSRAGVHSQRVVGVVAGITNAFDGADVDAINAGRLETDHVLIRGNKRGRRDADCFDGCWHRHAEQVQHIGRAVTATEDIEQTGRLHSRLDVDGVVAESAMNLVAVDVDRQQIDMDSDVRDEVDIDRVHAGEIHVDRVIARRANRNQRINSTVAIDDHRARGSQVLIADRQQGIDQDHAAINRLVRRMNHAIGFRVAIHLQCVILVFTVVDQRLQLLHRDCLTAHREPTRVECSRRPRRCVGCRCTGDFENVRAAIGSANHREVRSRIGQRQSVDIHRESVRTAQAVERERPRTGVDDCWAGVDRDRERVRCQANGRDIVRSVRAGDGDGQIIRADVVVHRDRFDLVEANGGIAVEREFTGVAFRSWKERGGNSREQIQTIAGLHGDRIAADEEVGHAGRGRDVECVVPRMATHGEGFNIGVGHWQEGADRHRRAVDHNGLAGGTAVDRQPIVAREGIDCERASGRVVEDRCDAVRC